MEKEDRKNEGERFFESGFEKAHTVVFFLDIKNRRIGMLKRAAGLDFAPNLYTGVGGKIEKDEGHIRGALRELAEELKEKDFSRENIQEFGRLIINQRNIISYFVLPYDKPELPGTEKNIGELGWMGLDAVLQADIIPTTRFFMEEWAKRDWSADHPFTVFLERKDANDINSDPVSVEVREGLL